MHTYIHQTLVVPVHILTSTGSTSLTTYNINKVTWSARQIKTSDGDAVFFQDVNGTLTLGKGVTAGDIRIELAVDILYPVVAPVGVAVQLEVCMLRVFGMYLYTRESYCAPFF